MITIDNLLPMVITDKTDDFLWSHKGWYSTYSVTFPNVNEVSQLEIFLRDELGFTDIELYRSLYSGIIIKIRDEFQDILFKLYFSNYINYRYIND